MKKIGYISILFIFLINSVLLCYAEEERPQLTFDGRVWSIGYQAKNYQCSIIEYVLDKETVNNWTELVTVQAFPGLQNNTTLQSFMMKTRENLKSQCPDLNWKVLSKKENDAIYEWSIKNCPTDEDQHEIARIISGEYGIYVIHYVTKKMPISTKVRKKWIGLLRSVTLNQQSQNKDDKPTNNTAPISERWLYSTS